MKLVHNYTRHVYFKTLDAFTEFMYILRDEVNLIMAPISKKHCDALKKVMSCKQMGIRTMGNKKQQIL